MKSHLGISQPGRPSGTRRIGVLRALLFAALAAALAAAPVAPARITLQLKWHHQFQFAGYYAAQDQGYYREAGLEVDAVEAEPGIDVVKEVVSGRAQYGVGNSALLLARQRGAPVVVLATVFQHSPMILMTKPGSGIDSVHDLPGKRLMIERQADELIAYLHKEGVSEKSLTLIDHSFDPNDLITGKVDCISAYVTDETYFLEKAGQPVLEFSPRMGGIDFYGDNLFTSEAELKAHPARVRAFREASMKGWKYAMQHPEEVADRIIARYGQRRGRDYLLWEAQKMVTLLQPVLVEMGYMYPGRWQHIADTYVELGLLPKDFRMDGFLYDPEAGVRQDVRRLGTALAVVLVLLCFLGGAALVFLRLTLRLRREVASRERAEEATRLEHETKAALQAQLQQAQKMESLGSLAGGVAHDMNNVLGAILGMASAHLEAQPEGSSTRRAFDTIIRAAERGGQMVKGLLSFARVSPGEQRLLDLNALVREEAQLLERTTLSRVVLELQLAGDLAPIRGDAGALSHAILNLCVNAVDAMDGAGTLTVRTGNGGDGWVELEVADTGAGMAPEVLERALDPFFTTKPLGRGTGLGLSMVYSTVQAHRGRLQIESAPGQGTRIRLGFPACADSEAAPGPAPAPAPQGRSLKVLLVDDEELIRGSMLEVLEVLGHHACEACSGEEALALLEGGLEPDVAIMDMNMPGLGGAGTLPLLRALRPALPVLLVTGRADRSVLQLIEAHPGVSLLAKPFTMRELQQQLGQLE